MTSVMAPAPAHGTQGQQAVSVSCLDEASILQNKDEDMWNLFDTFCSCLNTNFLQNIHCLALYHDLALLMDHTPGEGDHGDHEHEAQEDIGALQVNSSVYRLL